MIRTRVVLNSDAINRYGYRFSIGALEDGLEQKAIEGIPTCLGHDRLNPVGWTIPFGLYFEPGLCRQVGTTYIPETEEERLKINHAHFQSITQKNYDHCSPHLEEF